MSFIRFQTGMRCRETGRALGIFAAAGRLEDQRAIEPWFEAPLKETLTWFNRNLKVPKSAEIHWRCLFWFDRDSSEMFDRVWDLVTWLRQHDVFVQSRLCDDPGRIMYRDTHQIAAVPSQRIYRTLGIKKS